MAPQKAASSPRSEKGESRVTSLLPMAAAEAQLPVKAEAVSMNVRDRRICIMVDVCRKEITRTGDMFGNRDVE